MKKFTSLLIACSLMLAGAALAQQPEEQATPKPKGVEKGKGQGRAVQDKGAQNVVKPEATTAPAQNATINKRTEPKVKKMESTPKPTTSTSTETNVSGQPGATPGGKKEKGNKGMKAKENTTATPTATAAAKGAKGMKATEKTATATPTATAAKGSATATPAPEMKATATPTATANATSTPATTPSATAAASVTPASQANVRGGGAGAAKKPDPQKVEQIKTQHANFKAQPKPDKVPAVTFNENRRIEGSDRWQGQQYEVFRSYRAERHDEGWYRSRYNRVELIGGGYYYWNNGYWYPAWGYNPSNEYYAYDGPIYVGHRAEPPDRVIADVQAELQEMGYYKGEVDGLLGPLTRQALTGYQADNGLAPTAAIDEPTLDSLGMG